MGPHLVGLLLIDRLPVVHRFGASVTEDRLLEPLEAEKHEQKANDHPQRVQRNVANDRHADDQNNGKHLDELDG